MNDRQIAQVRKLIRLGWSTHDICAEKLANHGRRMLACCPKGVSPEAHRRLVERVFGPLGAT